jgi:hypothetical protein
MQHYVGTKIIKATPMTRGDYNVYRGWDIPADENPEDTGYLVEYTDGGQPNHPKHDGYISWSPSAVFEGAYLPMGDVSAYPDWVQRLVAEKAQLDDRLVKLTAYLDKIEIVNPHVLKLREQQELMRSFSKLLAERLEMVN